jgi:hypothetical protein
VDQLTTRELLYLEDMSKMFESIAKTCDTAAQNAVDPQFRAYLQAIANERRQWIAATASIAKSSPVQ